MARKLSELQRIPTSGARAVEAFAIDGRELLAIPQLAYDVPGTAAGMNAGDSNTELLILERQGAEYVAFATLPAPGGEDAEFFTIADRSFLAVACIRTGSGPYGYFTDSFIYEWNGTEFELFQAIPAFAAKQWKHWTIGDRHFLGLAQGLALPHFEGRNRDSVIFEWDGSKFGEFQTIPSQWAYNWHAFELADQHFLAHADHVGESVLYRWTGSQYLPHQPLLARTGRAFATFSTYLIVAGLSEPPSVLRWDGDRFAANGTLDGLGTRELTIVEHDGHTYLIRINFILGTPADPQPSLTSQLYEWRDGFELLADFPTTGGTDAEVLSVDDGIVFAVSNSLSAEIRFAGETVIYRLAD
ncbi:hypothetical protein E1263_01025 [Kribbella antibiotica]|uniref:EPTP domain-containing protein n=1 Tax=Kribbella antibiotica TaxID=190195 RepID=A0A4R4ZVM6_9ACTN|nr:hypothetical protein [Kribbella antibiotica]TDD63241.1 hypothetical protein E1263_01025 [Kribbella antibiotica]